MSNIIENNITKTFNRVFINYEIDTNSPISAFGYLLLVGFLAFIFSKNRHLGILSILMAVICFLVISNVSSRKESLFKKIFIRNICMLTIMTTTFFSFIFSLFIGENFVAFYIYIIYFVMIICLVISSWISHIFIVPYLTKGNLKLTKSGATIGVVMIGFVFSQALSRRINSLSEQYAFVDELVMILILVGALVFYAYWVGSYTAYIKILNKYPYLEQKCLQAKSVHEEELAKIDPKIAKYLEKKRAEENRNDKKGDC